MHFHAQRSTTQFLIDLMKSARVWLLILSIAALVAFWLYNKYRVAPNVQLEQLTLYNLDGTEFDATDLRGKTVFVNYWASWCGDCLREMPSIELAWHNVDTNNVVFLMISDQPLDDLNNYLMMHPYHMKFVQSGERLQEIGINTLPTTYIYDDEGHEILTKVGSADWADPGIIELLKNP